MMEIDEEAIWKKVNEEIKNTAPSEIEATYTKIDKIFMRKKLIELLRRLLFYINELVVVPKPLKMIIKEMNHHPPICYDKNKRAMVVDPNKILDYIYLLINCTDLGFIDILFYFVLHEFGHYQLDIDGITPPKNVYSPRFLSLYSKFEDYAISKLIRGDRYRAIEEIILRFNALRFCREMSIPLLKMLPIWHLNYLSRSIITRSIDKIATIALAYALSYLDLQTILCQFDVPNGVLMRIELISSNMTKIDSHNIGSLPEIAYSTWIKFISIS